MKQPKDMQRLRLSREWLDARDAARELGPCTPKHLTEEIGPLITRQSRSLTGARTARGVGYAYARHDIERLRAIMLALGCQPLRAAQILHGIRALGEKGMLAEISAELNSTIARERPRRRFQ